MISLFYYIMNIRGNIIFLRIYLRSSILKNAILLILNKIYKLLENTIYPTCFTECRIILFQFLYFVLFLIVVFRNIISTLRLNNKSMIAK